MALLLSLNPALMFTLAGASEQWFIDKFTMAMHEKLVSTRLLLFLYFNSARLESCRIFSRPPHGTPCHTSPNYEVSKVSSMGILSGVSTSHAFKLKTSRQIDSSKESQKNQFGSLFKLYKSSSLHR